MDPILFEKYLQVARAHNVTKFSIRDGNLLVELSTEPPKEPTLEDVISNEITDRQLLGLDPIEETH